MDVTTYDLVVFLLIACCLLVAAAVFLGNAALDLRNERNELRASLAQREKELEVWRSQASTRSHRSLHREHLREGDRHGFGHVGPAPIDLAASRRG